MKRAVLTGRVVTSIVERRKKEIAHEKYIEKVRKKKNEAAQAAKEAEERRIAEEKSEAERIERETREAQEKEMEREFPYGCKVCLERFQTSDDRRVHMRDDHGQGKTG